LTISTAHPRWWVWPPKDDWIILLKISVSRCGHVDIYIRKLFLRSQDCAHLLYFFLCVCLHHCLEYIFRWVCVSISRFPSNCLFWLFTNSSTYFSILVIYISTHENRNESAGEVYLRNDGLQSSKPMITN
jgi:hypothetical protein